MVARRMAFIHRDRDRASMFDGLIVSRNNDVTTAVFSLFPFHSLIPAYSLFDAACENMLRLQDMIKVVHLFAYLYMLNALIALASVAFMSLKPAS